MKAIGRLVPQPEEVFVARKSTLKPARAPQPKMPKVKAPAKGNKKPVRRPRGGGGY